jgi:glycyl-tRNA synthetase
MNPKVWEKSGHLEAFTDPLVECRVCHRRFRIDHLPGVTHHQRYYEFDEYPFECPTGGHDIDLGMEEKLAKGERGLEPRYFNLLMEVKVGVVEEEKKKAFLRGEITQGVFVNFKNIIDSTSMKIPFGIAQIGKAFRNEITPGNFTYRTREFEQMELEFFIKPEDKEAKKWFAYWKKQRMDWYLNLGMKKENLRFREHGPDELAHYCRVAEDVEYKAPFGWSEFEGIHDRGDWDLSRHNLKYLDEENKKEYTPWVIETSGGVDRTALFFLINAYHEEKERVVLKLAPELAPHKVAVFPLLANKPKLVNQAKKIYQTLKKDFPVAWDDRGNIGKRYYAQDEIGTPWCVTVDFQTLKDKTVTIRDRDTTKQKRLKVDKLTEWFQNILSK